MVVWEKADDIRKTLNWIAPLVAIVLALVYNLAYLPSLTRSGFMAIFSIFSPAISGIEITGLICGILGGGLYFIPKLGPFMGVKSDELYVWPEHVMMIITAVLASVGSWWGGVIMGIQFLMVSILGSSPIWEAEKTKA